jgi:hypothetical protein
MFACCLAAQALNVQAGGNIYITAGQATQNLEQQNQQERLDGWWRRIGL